MPPSDEGYFCLCSPGLPLCSAARSVPSGRRKPSRNRLLCLCFGLEASVEETQELLKLCAMAQLYPKLKRDAIIYYGLLHGLKLFEINDKLFDEDEEILF